MADAGGALAGRPLRWQIRSGEGRWPGLPLKPMAEQVGWRRAGEDSGSDDGGNFNFVFLLQSFFGISSMVLLVTPVDFSPRRNIGRRLNPVVQFVTGAVGTDKFGGLTTSLFTNSRSRRKDGKGQPPVFRLSFTGKPHIGEPGYAFLLGNCRAHGQVADRRSPLLPRRLEQLCVLQQ